MTAWLDLLRLRRSKRTKGQLEPNESSTPNLSVQEPGGNDDPGQSAPIVATPNVHEEDLLEYYAPEDIFAPDGDAIAPVNATNLTSHLQRPLFRRVPFEIWTKIFTLATIIPGKDDLIVDPISYVAMTCDKTSSNILTPTEQLQVYNGRLQIIQVCRYWYAIGVQVLWSHLRITLPGSTGTLRHVYNILERRPEISKSVIRLTIRYRPNLGHVGGVSVERMIKNLSSLRILCCPTEFGTIGHFYRPDIVVLNPQFKVHQTLPMLGGKFWLNIRILIFRQGLGRIVAYAPEEAEFPQLGTLQIHDEHGNVLRYIAEYWKMPALHTLSIETYSPPSTSYQWVKILESCAMNLQKLELLTRPPIGDQLEAITMNRLKAFYLLPGCSGWKNIIFAPGLQRLGLYIPSAMEYGIKAEIGVLVTAFPKIMGLCLSSDSILSERSGYHGWFSKADLDVWRRLGIDIELISPRRLFIVL